MEECHIPISAHFVIDDGKIICSDYTYFYISASEFADFLLGKFGIDAEYVERAEKNKLHNT